MSVGVAKVAADLVAEQDALDTAISGLDDETWSKPTASPRWSIADQIGHLAYFDHTATLAIADPDGFRSEMTRLLEHFGDDRAVDEFTLGAFRHMSPTTLLTRWRTNRDTLAAAATSLDDDTRVVWYGPSMGAKSFLTARLMECWAHGQDVIDAAGVQRPSTDRLAHIVRLGVITRGWSYTNRGLEAPDVPVFLKLRSPSGAEWVFGDDTASESIVGPAEDFCMVVTQRRHVDDTVLTVSGEAARDWMLKAQVFAGPPMNGPPAS
jgi:uncharacterized protein (TIGR03084 family)